MQQALYLRSHYSFLVTGKPLDVFLEFDHPLKLIYLVTTLNFLKDVGSAVSVIFFPFYTLVAYHFIYETMIPLPL